MGRCLPNHIFSGREPSVAFSATVTSRLLGGTSPRWSNSGAQSMRRSMSPERLCNQERDCLLCHSEPDRRTSVIAPCLKLRRIAPRLALRAKLVGTPIGLLFGGVRIAVEL